MFAVLLERARHDAAAMEEVRNAWDTFGPLLNLHGPRPFRVDVFAMVPASDQGGGHAGAVIRR